MSCIYDRRKFKNSTGDSPICSRAREATNPVQQQSDRSFHKTHKSDEIHPQTVNDPNSTSRLTSRACTDADKELHQLPE